jgi:hypothetical protein
MMKTGVDEHVSSRGDDNDSRDDLEIKQLRQLRAGENEETRRRLQEKGGPLTVDMDVWRSEQMGAKNRDRKNVLDARQNLHGHGATDVDAWKVDLRGAKDRDRKGRLEVMGNLQGHRGYYANKHSADIDRDTQGQAIHDRMEEMGHLSFDCARTDIQSAADCSRPINSTSTIKVRVRVGGVLLHLPHHPPHPPSDEVTELRSGGDCACTINSTSTIMVRVRVGGVLLDPPPHPPVFSPAILQHKRKITGFSSVKPPLSSSHNIINVRVRVNGVLVFPDSHDFQSRRRIQEVRGERCSVPLSERDLYHQRTHLCVSSGASCRTRVGQNVSHHSPPILVSPEVHPWVKVFKGKSSTSVRTQCASIAHMKSVSYKAFHRRQLRARNKTSKQRRLLREYIVPTNQFKLSHQDIHDHITVFDGGCHNNPPILPPDGVNWRCIHISQLHIDDELNPNVGLFSPHINNAVPFIRLPRRLSLDIIGQSGLQNMYKALDACEGLKKRPSVRGKDKQIFGDRGMPLKFVVMGVHVSRNSKEVLDCAPFMQTLPEHHWKALMKIMHRAETCFEQLLDHQVISHIHHAKRLVPYRTMTSPSTKSPLKYFGGLAYGCNVFLPHADDDFTMSIVQIFLKNRTTCQIGDDIVTHFCFPTLGVAVPLRPGDFLMFNARIPHCISSRCKQSDHVIALTMYLKTAVVGMNNNDLDLTTAQTSLLSTTNHSHHLRQL